MNESPEAMEAVWNTHKSHDM